MAAFTTTRGRTYEFSFERQSGGNIVPYIVRQPSYGSRDSGSLATHRLRDGKGRSYVCWTEPLKSVTEAMQVASGWAARTDVYIDTGAWKS